MHLFYIPILCACVIILTNPKQKNAKKSPNVSTKNKTVMNNATAALQMNQSKTHSKPNHIHTLNCGTTPINQKIKYQQQLKKTKTANTLNSQHTPPQTKTSNH